MTRTVAVIGGGPAGLYAARLLKLGDPALAVTVYERMTGAGDTFGFGVGLTESTMRHLADADPRTAEQVRAASHAGHELRLQGRTGVVPLHGARNLAIGRAILLDILAEAATSVGVRIVRGSRAEVTSVEADVVIAADGVGSATREKLAGELGVRSTLGRSRFVWCGAGFAVDSAFFSAVERGDSLFVAHAYPYAPDRSTFLIEVDETTWDDSDLGALDSSVQPGDTDQASVDLLQQAFSSELAGRPLLTNRTRWSRFTNLTLDRWWAGNVALIGDAAHTAHYTLGSGTKLALEDSIVLAQALIGEASVEAAFSAYESARRPAVERFKKLAHRSQAWWDSYRLRHRWPVERLALSYMTRSGNLALHHFAVDQPQVTREALSWLGTGLPSDPAAVETWVLRTPVGIRNLGFPERIVPEEGIRADASVRDIRWSEPEVWGEDADRLIASLALDDRLALIGGSNENDGGMWPRIDLAERIRLELSRPVGVRLPADEQATAATAIAAGRADFVVMP